MSVINTNVNALLSANTLTANSRVLGGARQQLTTGSHINAAKDDAAGPAIGSKMTSQVSQNAIESRSGVLDKDDAAATAKLVKSQIISQADTAMRAQANQQPQAVLALLK